MSFFGRLKKFYPAFALFYVSVIRLVIWYLISIPTRACTFIFATQCLSIYNLPVTVLATFVSQTLISNLISTGAVWPVPIETIVFSAVFCVLLGGLNIGLSQTSKEKDGNKDQVIPSLICGSLLFTILYKLMPHANLKEDDSGLFGMFFKETLQTVIIVFVTGPIKVWL